MAFIISAVIILATATVATVSLTKSTDTAQVVSRVITNVTHTMIAQTQINNYITHGLQALKAALEWLGDRQQDLVNQQPPQCDWQHDKICVTPFPYNHSQYS